MGVSGFPNIQKQIIIIFKLILINKGEEKLRLKKVKNNDKKHLITELLLLYYHYFRTCKETREKYKQCWCNSTLGIFSCILKWICLSTNTKRVELRCWNNHIQVFYRLVVPKNFVKFTEHHLQRTSFPVVVAFQE